MLNDINLINQLEDFKNTQKYTRQQFITFIQTIPCLLNFYNNSINEFNTFRVQYPSLIDKFADDISAGNFEWERRFRYSEEYTFEATKIISMILDKCLHLFYGLSIAQDDYFTLNTGKYDNTSIFLGLEYYDGQTEQREKLIDYIIKFCPNYENSQDTSLIGRKENPPVITDLLSKRETQVYNLIANGISVANIASKLTVAEPTVRTHINNICTKLKLENNGIEALMQYILNTNRNYDNTIT